MSDWLRFNKGMCSEHFTNSISPLQMKRKFFRVHLTKQVKTCFRIRFPFNFVFLNSENQDFFFDWSLFFHLEVRFLRVCKDFSIHPKRKHNITPHRCNPLFTFFQKHCNEFKFAHFHFASFLLKSFSYLNNGFFQALASFFLQECPFLKESFFRLERSKLMKIDFFSNSSEYVFKFIH